MPTGRHRQDEPWLELNKFIEVGDGKALEWYLEFLSPTELVAAVGRLEEAQKRRLLGRLSPALTARILDAFFDAGYDDNVGDMLPGLAAAQLVEVARSMPSNYADNFLQLLPVAVREKVLAGISGKKEVSLRLKISFPRGTAGDVMISDFLSYDGELTVGHVLRDMRENQQKYAEYNAQYAFVTAGAEQRLAGVLSLRDLLFYEGDTAVGTLSKHRPTALGVMAKLADMREFFEQHRFLAAPVVDDAKHLLGIVLREDVERMQEKQSNRNFLKFSGIVGGEEMRSMSVFQRCKKRLSFLSVNVFLACIACSAISIHEETLAKIIALAVFLPVMSDMCGCSGHQAVAVSIRELTMGLLRPREVWRVLWKEFSVGAINGVVLGAQLALVAWWWKGSPWIGIVVGAALACNTLISCVVGGTVPLVAARMKIDPALVSGPILTTITDLCGFFMIFGFASMLMHRLI